MPELDAMNPATPQENPSGLAIPNGEIDHEGAMAKADLYKLANYSFKLFKKMNDDDQIEAWVQAKITKAADYIASVYHYLEYEMKFNDYGHQLDNSDVMSESQKRELKGKLMEAKAKLKDLKIKQAEKASGKKPVDEGVLSGGERQCSECGGSGMVYEEPKSVPGHVKAKVEKYNRQAKAFHAASKRLDRNHNGIPDDEEQVEGFEAGAKPGTERKTATGVHTKTATGSVHKNTSFADGGDDDIAQRSGKGKKSHAKSMSAADKKAQAPKQKQSPKSAKTWGMKDSEKFDNRDKETEVDETYGQGIYENDMKVGDTKKTRTGVMTKTATGVKHTNTSHSDEEHGEPVSKVKSRSAADKASDKAADKAQEKDYKAAKKANPSGVRRYSLGKQIDEAGKKPDFLDMDKDGDKKEPMKKAVADKKKNPFAKKVDEAKPSAGLSKGEKSAVVKKAKAGGDIGKPGKSFDKVAKAAGGGEKGKKIAAAAMWKNIKEGVKIAEAEKAAKKDYDGDGEVESGKDEYLGSKDKAIKAAMGKDKKETVKESTEFTRMQDQLARLTRAETTQINESSEADQIRALTKRLLG